MLIRFIEQLARCRVVLASASPRRAEILRSLGLTVEVVPSVFAEDLDKSTFASAGDYAAETATHKAIEVCSRLLSPQTHANSQTTQQDGARPAPHVIIAADTVVEVDGVLLEKPSDADDARRMLRLLSGRKHKVYTGVVLLLPHAKDPSLNQRPYLRAFHECTQVEFGKLSDAEVNAYVATGEPMDKAGGYGIQGLGGCLVKGIIGCYFNVMGLPLHRLATELSAVVDEGLLCLPQSQEQPNKLPHT